MKTNTLWTGIIGSISSGAAYLLGGMDNLVIAFAIFMAADYVLGVFIGFSNSKLSSKRAIKGLIKKGAMIVLVIVANQLDIVTGSNGNFMRNAMLMFLIGTEGISIVENIGVTGIKVPSFLTNALEQLNKKEDK